MWWHEQYQGRLPSAGDQGGRGGGGGGQRFARGNKQNIIKVGLCALCNHLFEGFWCNFSAHTWVGAKKPGESVNIAESSLSQSPKQQHFKLF